MYQSKDFIETREGLVFAVVADRMENNKVLCFLRYLRERRQWRKVSTGMANVLLAKNYPQYLHYSTTLDAELHAVAVSDIAKHHQPQHRLATLLNNRPKDSVEQDLQTLCNQFGRNDLQLENVGVTGSLLIGAQNAESDIDLVFYGRPIFHQARAIMATLINQEICQSLTENAWLESYQRRDCDLTLAEYVWHEQRKFNKVMINQRKVDLNMIVENVYQDSEKWTKSGKVNIQARVMDDSHGFDYPAVFLVEHDDIPVVICFTATYTGQAKAGEMIEVSGQLEKSADGEQRVIVGSTREARGEYIKVLKID